MESKPKKNIRDYFRSNPRFLIPAYQRGYKWGVCGTDGSSAAKSLVTDIKKAFEKDNRDFQGYKSAHIPRVACALVQTKNREIACFCLQSQL